MVVTLSLPFRVFARHVDVRRIVAQTANGSFGILPRRLDCVAVLTAGILVWEDAAGETHYIATDDGLLVKHGPNVDIAVHHAIANLPLGELRAAVSREFASMDETERQLRTTLGKLEQGFVRRFARLQHD